MFKRLLVMVLAVVLMSSLCTAKPTILIISDSGYINTDGDVVIPNPEGKTKYNDSSLVWWLESLGYNVDTRGMASTYWRSGKIADVHPELDGNWWDGDDWRLQAVENATLIFCTRFMSSGRYDGNDKLANRDRYMWNTLEKPLIMQNGPLARGGTQVKWGWEASGVNTKPSATETEMDLAGFPLLEWTVFDFSVFGGTTLHPVQTCNGPWAGTVLTTYVDQYGFIVDIEAGTDLDAFNGTAPGIYGVTGGNRAFFDIWGYDGKDWPGNDGYNWAECLTDTYKYWLAGVIASKVPEPATIALLGLGGLALLRKRR